MIKTLANYSIVFLLVLAGCQPVSDSGSIVPITSIDHLYDVIGRDEVSYVYFGRPTCPDCEDFMIILEDFVSENKILVYYFNTDDLRNEAEYEDIIEVFEVTWVPALYKVQQNAIIDKFPLLFERDPSDVEVDECRQVLNVFFGVGE